MRRRHSKVNRWVLVAVALFSLGLYWVETRTLRPVKTRAYEVKLAAARLTHEAFQLAKAMRDSLKLPIDSVNDPNLTGLVGVQFSPITWGRADLSDALTTINPNFSAAIVELLIEAGVRRGDTVGVSWDGSFPALNIAILAATREMGVVPVVVTTMSSAMWGANLPDWTWPDIESRLSAGRFPGRRNQLAFVGGEDDQGQGLSPEGRQILAEAAVRSGLKLAEVKDLKEGAALRRAALGRVKAALCVGRAAVHSGDAQVTLPSRILRGRADRNRAGGLVRLLLEDRVPVIHIANPRRIASRYRLPIAPEPMPEPGRGRLFLERRYSVWLAGLFIVLLAIVLWFIVRYDIESYFGVKRNPEEEVSV